MILPNFILTTNDRKTKNKNKTPVFSDFIVDWKSLDLVLGLKTSQGSTNPFVGPEFRAGRLG